MVVNGVSKEEINNEKYQLFKDIFKATKMKEFPSQIIYYPENNYFEFAEEIERKKYTDKAFKKRLDKLVQQTSSGKKIRDNTVISEIKKKCKNGFVRLSSIKIIPEIIKNMLINKEHQQFIEKDDEEYVH